MGFFQLGFQLLHVLAGFFQLVIGFAERSVELICLAGNFRHLLGKHLLPALVRLQLSPQSLQLSAEVIFPQQQVGDPPARLLHRCPFMIKIPVQNSQPFLLLDEELLCPAQLFSDFGRLPGPIFPLLKQILPFGIEPLHICLDAVPLLTEPIFALLADQYLFLELVDVLASFGQLAAYPGQRLFLFPQPVA